MKGAVAIEDWNGTSIDKRDAGEVNDAGWSAFIQMFSYQAECAGRVLVKVDPRRTPASLGARVGLGGSLARLPCLRMVGWSRSGPWLSNFRKGREPA
jgi:hypothetical protein